MRLNSNKVVLVAVYFAALLGNAIYLNAFYTSNLFVIAVFILSILFNQVTLLYITYKINQNDLNYAVASVGILFKLFILLVGFFIAMGHSDKSTLFLVGSYIFQLIILVLSITRIT